MIVEVGHRFEQLDVQLLRLRRRLGRNRLFRFGVRVEAARPVISARSTYPLKLLGAAERPLFGYDVAAVRVLQRRERAGEVGAGAVHLVHDEDMRHLRRSSR